MGARGGWIGAGWVPDGGYQVVGTVPGWSGYVYLAGPATCTWACLATCTVPRPAWLRVRYLGLSGYVYGYLGRPAVSLGTKAGLLSVWGTKAGLVDCREASGIQAEVKAVQDHAFSTDEHLKQFLSELAYSISRVRFRVN